MKDLLMIEQAMKELKEMKQIEADRHKHVMDSYEKTAADLERTKSILLAELDLEKIERASIILKIEESGYDASCVKDAIQDILNDTEQLRTKYFGSKHFEGFRYQRSDHGYFMGPRHGYIVFSVGLNMLHRNGLTEQEADDCLYYLNAYLDQDKRAILQKQSNKKVNI